jgi:hypothetical protein
MPRNWLLRSRISIMSGSESGRVCN